MIRQRPHRRVTIALLAVATAALLIRCVTIAEPLGIDQSLWASAVRGMARGQLLYHDVWEQRPPAIYWTYLAAFKVLGWKTSTVAWLDMFAAWGTTMLLFVLGRRLAGSLTGATAAALYAVLTHPAWLFGHGGFLERSVCETFTPLCVALAAWGATRYRDGGSTGWMALCGIFASAAVVYKPNAGLYFPALLLWLALYRREPELSRVVRGGAIAIAASTILPAITLLWLWRLDLLHDAKVAVIDFNRFYVSQGFSIAGYALDFSKAVWLRIKTDPLWTAGAMGAVAAIWGLARTRSLPPAAGLAVLWGGAGALVIAVNGAWLFNSYFMQVFAPLALLGAWLLSDAARHSKGYRVLALATGMVMAILLVTRNYPARVLTYARADLAALRGHISEAEYFEQYFGGYGNDRGYSARANAELAAFVRARTTPDDRIFLFGINGAGVYFLTDRLTAHRFLRVNDFVEMTFPDPAFRLESVVSDLQARRPRYLIFERLNSKSEMGQAADRLQEEPSVLRLLAAYHRETQIEDFTVYRLND
jgi:4-amino-4-deoxy-L-arabinose transferase-like glycosyltransferase